MYSLRRQKVQDVVHVLLLQLVQMWVLFRVEILKRHMRTHPLITLFSTEPLWRWVHESFTRFEVIFVFVSAKVELVVQLVTIRRFNEVIHFSSIITNILEVDGLLRSCRLS